MSVILFGWAESMITFKLIMGVLRLRLLIASYNYIFVHLSSYLRDWQRSVKNDITVIFYDPYRSKTYAVLRLFPIECLMFHQLPFIFSKHIVT